MKKRSTPRASSSFARLLVAWYHRHKRDLPWRCTRDPYKIWISEVMLQQTTVATVIPYYRRWFRLFPTLRSLASSPLPKVLKAWEGLGYYHRARHLHAAARLFAEDFGGRVPADPVALRRAPGFGSYTTGAVLSIAYQQPLVIIDANVRRVISRFLGLRKPSGPDLERPIGAFLEKVLPRERPGDFNQALMEFGALICKPSGPLCPSCPIRSGCIAFKKRWQDVIPAQKIKKIEKIRAVVAVIEDAGRLFMQQRPSTGLLAGLWELPGGKIKLGEESAQALGRELREELGISLTKSEHLFSIKHAYTRFQVDLDVQRCTVEPLPGPDKTHKWLKRGQVSTMPMPSATVKALRRLGY
jgi:A/G-specific adenine glycosylase